MTLLAAAIMALSPYAFPPSGYIAAVPVLTVHVEAVEAPVEWVTMRLFVTHYSCSVEERTEACVESHTGNRPTIGTAASRVLPAGTELVIDGQGYQIRDICGGCRFDGVDVYVPTRSEALQRGAGWRDVGVKGGTE